MTSAVAASDKHPWAEVGIPVQPVLLVGVGRMGMVQSVQQRVCRTAVLAWALGRRAC